VSTLHSHVTYVRPDQFLSSDCIYHFCEGHDATQHAAFGEAAHIAVTLRMHEESSYEGLDFIECEVRRRTFWLLFGGAEQVSFICSVRLLNVTLSGQIDVHSSGATHLPPRRGLHCAFSKRT
jgi:hypothetical protein